VGKSSALDAGLRPWLEVQHAVLYRSRNPERGLLGTLVDLLGSTSDGATSSDLISLWTVRAGATPGKPLVVILDQAEEAFTRPLPLAASAPATGPAPQSELALLFTALAGLFDPDRPTRDRLLLSFRKEWLTEFQAAARTAGLAWSERPLGPLDRDEIMSAIEGPARDPTVRKSCCLTVDPGLAGEIADDLLAYIADPSKNRESPIAPTLQILLRRMWDEVKHLDDKARRFDRALYISVKEKAYGLPEFLDDQFKVLESRYPRTVSSGLVLDVLESHTTALGTARSRHSEDLRTRFAHRADIIDGLIGHCTNLYLLVKLAPPAPPGTTRLAHDTLAPLIREMFRTSIADGQRARRLLENRAHEWEGGRKGSVLA
jgi:hypothetical protein